MRRRPWEGKESLLMGDQQAFRLQHYVKQLGE